MFVRAFSSSVKNRSKSEINLSRNEVRILGCGSIGALVNSTGNDNYQLSLKVLTDQSITTIPWCFPPSWHMDQIKRPIDLLVEQYQSSQTTLIVIDRCLRSTNR